MSDLWHLLTNTIDHNRGIVAAVALAGAMACWLVGCQATTSSLMHGDQQVTASQLHDEAMQLDQQLQKQRRAIETQISDYNAEVELLKQRAAAATEDLQRQNELRQQIVQTLGGFAAQAVGGTFDPISAVSAVITLVAGAAAAGLGYDNRRKDQVIADLKSTGLTATASPGSVSASSAS
ncbi:MAG: hypothetical protein IT440_06490 [Phycisphaeraceae bacterium]|nr:hypothetical protein [Phycisphaeraceae bacterium]